MKTVLFCIAYTLIACAASGADQLNIVLGGEEYSIPISNKTELDLRIELPRPTKGNTTNHIGLKYSFNVMKGGIEVQEEESCYAGPAKAPKIITTSKSYRLEPGRPIQLASGYEISVHDIVVTDAQ
jgi:hypothetical protein